jgi:hypothetical protein
MIVNTASDAFRLGITCLSLRDLCYHNPMRTAAASVVGSREWCPIDQALASKLQSNFRENAGSQGAAGTQFGDAGRRGENGWI